MMTSMALVFAVRNSSLQSAYGVGGTWLERGQILTDESSRFTGLFAVFRPLIWKERRSPCSRDFMLSYLPKFSLLRVIEIDNVGSIIGSQKSGDMINPTAKSTRLSKSRR